MLLAKPNASILYATLARGPKLPFEYQINSTRHFMRELNRLGITGVIDAGGGFQNYPDDYAVIQQLSDEGLMTVRLAYNLFTQKPKEEKEDFLNWTRSVTYKQGNDYFRHNGAGEMLVFSAADFVSPGLKCRRKWRASSKKLFAYWQKIAGRGDFMLPMMKPYHVHSMYLKR